MKIVKQIQISIPFNGSSTPTIVSAMVNIGSSDDTALSKQYSAQYTLSANGQAALATVLSEILQDVKTNEGI